MKLSKGMFGLKVIFVIMVLMLSLSIGCTNKNDPNEQNDIIEQDNLADNNSTSADYEDNKDVKDNKDSKDNEDNKNNEDNKDNKDNKDDKDNKDKDNKKDKIPNISVSKVFYDELDKENRNDFINRYIKLSFMKERKPKLTKDEINKLKKDILYEVVDDVFDFDEEIKWASLVLTTEVINGKYLDLIDTESKQWDYLVNDLNIFESVSSKMDNVILTFGNEKFIPLVYDVREANILLQYAEKEHDVVALVEAHRIYYDLYHWLFKDGEYTNQYYGATQILEGIKMDSLSTASLGDAIRYLNSRIGKTLDNEEFSIIKEKRNGVIRKYIELSYRPGLKPKLSEEEKTLLLSNALVDVKNKYPDFKERLKDISLSISKMVLNDKYINLINSNSNEWHNISNSDNLSAPYKYLCTIAELIDSNYSALREDLYIAGNLLSYADTECDVIALIEAHRILHDLNYWLLSDGSTMQYYGTTKTLEKKEVEKIVSWSSKNITEFLNLKIEEVLGVEEAAQ